MATQMEKRTDKQTNISVYRVAAQLKSLLTVALQHLNCFKTECLTNLFEILLLVVVTTAVRVS